jgi:hypothetical protein
MLFRQGNQKSDRCQGALGPGCGRLWMRLECRSVTVSVWLLSTQRDVAAVVSVAVALDSDDGAGFSYSPLR